MRLYLAGAEMIRPDGKYSIEIPNDCYILNSFYYTTDETTDRIISNIGTDRYLLDSGAFTFRFKGLKGIDINTFVDRYIEFIRRFSIEYFFEMDIDMNRQELDKVKYFRNKIEDKTGRKCIPVWHKTRGIDEWYDILDKYDYVAIGGITSALDKKYQEIIKRMIRIANSKGVKVHGLGYNRRDMLDFNFFSCDATSWNGGKYGNIWEFNSTTGYPVHTKPNKERRIISSKQGDVMRHNFMVWYTYQKYLRSKGFWHE